MKLSPSLNQLMVTALVIAGGLGLAVIFSGHPILIDLQCSLEQGCRVIIDSR